MRNSFLFTAIYEDGLDVQFNGIEADRLFFSPVGYLQFAGEGMEWRGIAEQWHCPCCAWSHCLKIVSSNLLNAEWEVEWGMKWAVC